MVWPSISLKKAIGTSIDFLDGDEKNRLRLNERRFILDCYLFLFSQPASHRFISRRAHTQTETTWQTQADRTIRIDFSFGRESLYITIRVHASISLQHGFSFACASHVVKMKASRY